MSFIGFIDEPFIISVRWGEWTCVPMQRSRPTLGGHQHEDLERMLDWTGIKYAFDVTKKRRRKDAMAQKKAADSCLAWIADEQRVQEGSDYGANKRAVGDALTDQRHHSKVVSDYSKQVKDVCDKLDDDEEKKEHVNVAYGGLQAVCERRLSCLEQMDQVAGLEELVGQLSVEFAERATRLVTEAAAKPCYTPPEKDGEGVARQTHSCIQAMRSNWAWISKLVKCTDVHLTHSAEYHQFFHDASEYETSMPVEMRKVQNMVNREGLKGNHEDANQLLIELKAVLTIFLHWQQRVMKLFERSKKVVPVKLRTQNIDFPRPAVSLCDYQTKDIAVKEGEELTLMDNTKAQTWQIRTMQEKDGEVPSVICVIPAPDPEAIQIGIKRLLELLVMWMDNVKRIGKTLIHFLLLVFRQWTDEEEEYIKALPADTKAEIRRMMDFIEGSLLRYWAEYPDFQKLQGRFNRTRELLDMEGEAKYRDSDMGKMLVVQIGVVEEVIKRYQDLWRHWEAYRVLVETTRHAEYVLLAQQWEDLNYVSIEELLKRWQQSLLDDDDLAVEEEIVAEVTEEVDAMMEDDDTMYNIETSRETAEADQYSTAEQEERKTFVITGVVDTRNDETISLDQAVMLGIINQSTGTYHNLASHESYPIPVAMNAGFIKVEFTTVKKTEEKKKDIGLITITTVKDSRPFTVKGVIDAKTDEKISVDEAIRRKILDQNMTTYSNSVTGDNMSLGDALDSQMLDVEFDKGSEASDPETVTKTYAIYAVVDQKLKDKVTWSEALRKGLIDQKTGDYYHNVNKENIYPGDAIKKGFVKAYVVADPSKMGDISSENQIVVDRLKNVRDKILNPMKAIAAMRGAAAEARKAGK